MATAVVARPVARPQARARDEEVLVWPDLVFVEFISAMLFTITLFILSVVMNAPLLDQANADVTPNPSKAPWYLLNLQELLLHMNAAMAGIIIPTVWLVMLGGLPVLRPRHRRPGRLVLAPKAPSRSRSSPGLVGFVGTWLLILWDSGKIAFFLNDWFGLSGGDTLRFLENVRSMQSQLAVAGVVTRYHLPAVQPANPRRHGLGRPDYASSTWTSPAGSLNRRSRSRVIVGLPCLLIYTMWRHRLGHRTGATHCSRSSAASSARTACSRSSAPHSAVRARNSSSRGSSKSVKASRVRS